MTEKALDLLDLKSEGILLDDLIAHCHAVLSGSV